METTGPTIQRVLPDGCADIIYTRSQGETALRFVGPMTSYSDVTLAVGTTLVGIRFRPAMWTAIVQLRGEDATDRLIALEDLWGKTAAELLRRLDSTDNMRRLAEILAAQIRPPGELSVTQRAIQFLEQSGGQIPVDRLGESAGVSERQFRRRCLEDAALTPKLLSRILRFRKAQALLAAGHEGADVAVKCGYFDQSHLIAEFRKLSGSTPTLATTAHRRRARIAREPGCRSGEDKLRVERHDEPCD